MRWLVGQAVKTLASHAENMGSIPVRVTRKRKSRTLVLLFLFLCPAQNRTHLRHIINLHFIMLVFAQGVRIPPLAVSCVIRRVGRRIANSRTCLALGVCYVHYTLVVPIVSSISSPANIPLCGMHWKTTDFAYFTLQNRRFLYYVFLMYASMISIIPFNLAGETASNFSIMLCFVSSWLLVNITSGVMFKTLQIRCSVSMRILTVPRSISA